MSYFYLFKIRRYRKIKRIIIIFTAVIFIISFWFWNYRYKKFYNIVTKEVSFDATIIEELKDTNYYKAFIIKGENSIFKNKKFILYTKQDLEFGCKVFLKGEFYLPNESRNYKGFNYKKYLQSNKIFGTIKAKKIEVISKDNVDILSKVNSSIRTKIINNIKKIMPDEEGAVLIGVLLGDKTYIEDDIITSFRDSSLAHILAISGLHVSYIIIGISFLISKTKVSKRWGYILTIIILILFLFLENFLVSVSRACIMAIVAIFSNLLHQKPDIINTIVISILIIISNNPFVIYSVGFWLSYLGTAGVIFLTPILENLFLKLKVAKSLAKVISVPIAAQVAIWPVMCLCFNKISLTFLISNLLVIPILGIIIIGGFILVFISFIWIDFAKGLSIILKFFLKLLILISKICSRFKLSNLYLVTPNLITIIIYYFILGFIVYLFNHKEKMIRTKTLKKIITLVVIIVILIEFPYLNFNGKLKIFFIDVGERRLHFNCKSKRKNYFNRWRKS